jgi:putative phage-type endonuclease
MPKIIEIEQRSSQWLKLRGSSVGSSEVSTVMGTSPFETPFGLWQIKTGRKPPVKVNAAMQRGIDYEDTARDLLERVSGISFTPKMFEHDTKSFMRVSLDGINADHSIICEIKCPTSDGLRQYGKEGKVPQYYESQIEYQMLVSGARKAKFFTWYSNDEFYLIDMEFDEKRGKEIEDKVTEFWQYILSDTPPQLTDKDYKEEISPSWQALAGEYLRLKSQFKDIESRFKEAEAQLKTKFKTLGHPAIKGAGVSLLEYDKKGLVNYSAIPELSNVDLEKYRKKSTKVIRIT